MSRRSPQEVERIYRRALAKRPHVTVTPFEEQRMRRAIAAGFDGVYPMTAHEHAVKVITRGAACLPRAPLCRFSGDGRGLIDGERPTIGQRAALDAAVRHFLESTHA